MLLQYFSVLFVAFQTKAKQVKANQSESQQIRANHIKSKQIKA